MQRDNVPAMTSSENYEVQLRRAVTAKRQADENLHAVAYTAHATGGLTWGQVAEIVGISRPTATANYRLPPMSMREPLPTKS